MPFVFGWLPLKCGFNLTLSKWTMLLRSVLVIGCVAGGQHLDRSAGSLQRFHDFADGEDSSHTA